MWNVRCTPPGDSGALYFSRESKGPIFKWGGWGAVFYVEGAGRYTLGGEQGGVSHAQKAGRCILHGAGQGVVSYVGRAGRCIFHGASMPLHLCGESMTQHLTWSRRVLHDTWKGRCILCEESGGPVLD